MGETPSETWARALAAYGEAWNEADPSARIALLHEALADDCRYVDWEFEARGAEAVSAVIGAYHERVEGFRIRPTSRVDAHHDVLRFTWVYAGREGGAEVEVDGADTILVAADGRLGHIAVFRGAHP